MHVSERCERGARFPPLHSGAGDRIEHPGGYDQNLARRSFYESDLRDSPLAHAVVIGVFGTRLDFSLHRVRDYFRSG
jgi:hypothetical protein